MTSSRISTLKIHQPVCQTTWHSVPKDGNKYHMLQPIGLEYVVAIKRSFFGLGRITSVGLRKPFPSRNCETCDLNCPLSKRERV